MENKEQTKDYLIIKRYCDGIGIRFRTLTKELYNDFLKDDYNYDDDKLIFEYDKVIKNFTWENYEHYLKHESKEFNLNDFDEDDLYKLISIFEPETIVGHCYDSYFGEKCFYGADYDKEYRKQCRELDELIMEDHVDLEGYTEDDIKEMLESDTIRQLERNAKREFEAVKEAIETIIEELKHIKNTRTYVYECEEYECD